MPDLMTFTPLWPEETEDTIRTRWEEWANEGLSIDDADMWTDVHEGSFFQVMTTPGVREFARFYDLAGREMLAASMAQWAWGSYLDDIGEAQGIDRLDATVATGLVKFTGVEGTEIFPGTVVGVEPSSPDDRAPTYVVTTGGLIGPTGVVLPVQAEELGSQGNTPPGAITLLLTPTAGVAGVTNDDPIVGGTDVETDEAYRNRILERDEGIAVANQRYYRAVALSYPGVGRVAVLPATPSAGQIKIIVATAEGEPVSGEVVTGLQELLDPNPGTGEGEGQVGATITVVTASALAVDISGTVELLTGYSMDGSGGTIPVAEAIYLAIAEYIETVQPGEEVVLAHVIGRIVSVTGVHDVADIELNGDALNLPVPVSPSPKVAVMGTIDDLVEGVV